ncbi:MAG: hypothetical protein FWD23_11375 [Oscillospiraceae bacterium]|nr:hypothetical protein [Oscillospiraceae bacterium]
MQSKVYIKRERKKYIIKINKKRIIVIFIIVLVFGIAFIQILRAVTLHKSTEFFFGVERSELHMGGVKYIPVGGIYTSGKNITWTDGFTINSLKDDPSKTFVCVTSFLDSIGLFVREDYIIPLEGKVTAVCWEVYTNTKKIKDLEFCQAISDLYNYNGEVFEYEFGVPHGDDLNKYMKDLYIAYEDCPVATIQVGSIGKINNQLVFAKRLSLSPEYDEASNSFRYLYSCRIIPLDYLPIVQKYEQMLDLSDLKN